MASPLKRYVLVIFTGLVIFSQAHAASDIETLFEEGIREFNAGRYQDAIDLFTEIILIDPENAKAFKNRGVSLMKIRKIDYAIIDFEKAIKIAPRLNGIYSNLGAAWHIKGEYARAIANYDIDIEQDPTQYITYFNRSLSLAGLKKYDMALKDLEKVMEINPEFEGALAVEKEIYKILRNTDQEKYTVQTGAFHSEKNATNMKARLVKKGYHARVLEITDTKNNSWYLVRCGKNLSYDQAIEIRRQLKTSDKLEAVIRPSGRF